MADYFERIEETELGFFTITGVEVDSDLNIAQVFFSIFGEAAAGNDERDAAVLDILGSHRKAVQRVIASQAKLRKTPEVVFAFDPAVRAGAKIDSILARIEPLPEAEDEQ